MENQTKTVEWNDERQIAEVLDDARNQRAEYLIVAARPDHSIPLTPPLATDLIVFRDSSSAQRWGSLSRTLPANLYFLAVLPSYHSAVAISVPTIEAHLNMIADARSLTEFVVRLSDVTTATFVDDVTDDFPFPFTVPGLSQHHARPNHQWVCELIQKIAGTKYQASSTALAALKAGLFLVNNFFDDSHTQSQSIEGLGAHHTGDYWHAILHRREPDYGNSKYWFRHVGRHPAFLNLAQAVNRQLNEVGGMLTTKLQPWKSRLVSHAGWDPFAFVDLCAAAENDAELRAWCEQVQYEEMLLLLEYSAADVIKNPQF